MVKRLAEKLLEIIFSLLIKKVEELLNEDIDGDGSIG